MATRNKLKVKGQVSEPLCHVIDLSLVLLHRYGRVWTIVDTEVLWVARRDD